jgi:hypothetical protein
MARISLTHLSTNRARVHFNTNILKMKLNRRHSLLAIGTLSAVITGCGGTGSPFDSVPVSGKITYEDGSLIPAQGIKVYFHCLEPPINGMHPRPATVGVGTDGTFNDVTTYKYADGLVIGKHKVSLVCLEGGKLTPKIPKEYAVPATTPLRIEITEAGQTLEIKIPKPKV